MSAISDVAKTKESYPEGRNIAKIELRLLALLLD